MGGTPDGRVARSDNGRAWSARLPRPSRWSGTCHLCWIATSSFLSLRTSAASVVKINQARYINTRLAISSLALKDNHR